jgi:rhodanese-related sulfurtransferase
VPAGDERAPLAWRAVDAFVHLAAPDVASLPASDLAAWLDDDAREPPLLLDARAPEEYAASHLPGAMRVDPDASPETLAAEVAALRDPGGERPMVVYCSVGVRSARVADRLQHAGLGEVYNLEGSIFRWAEEGRPLVRDGERVHTVHPYDALWGLLLPRDLRAE